MSGEIDLSPDAALLDVALDLTRGLATEDRNQRLVDAVLRVVPADAAAILARDGDALVPLAHRGFVDGFADARFVVDEHPRLAAIVAATDVVRFPADDVTPDPYDGLLAGDHPRLDVHACLGAPLRVDGELVGALTVDAHQPGRFDAIPTELISTFSALAAAAARIARLIDALARAAELERGVALALTADARSAAGGELLGSSPAMKSLREEIEVVAPSDLSVLVQGETGTGKELVARTIHARSSRADRALVSFNCAALTTSLAESELFGHEKGAFTGATNKRIGKFELADGGTLFLDEVGELAPEVQAKLLRVLQFGELQRLGSDRARTVDVRVVAATNRDLQAAVRDGRFRADLYHRLAVYPLLVPPLRERREDVLLLAEHVLRRAARAPAEVLGLTRAAGRALRAHAWPGNVRELEHLVLRGALRARAEDARRIDVRHLDVEPPVTQGIVAPSPAVAGRTMREATDAFQRALIERTRAAEGTWAATARALGVDRSNLVRTAHRLGLVDA